MHVVLYHHAVIPPQKYGGTERIVYWLGKALLAKGHRVTLISRAGSHLEGANLIEATEDWEKKIPSDADLLHLWATPPWGTQSGRSPTGLPFVVTIQGNGKPGEVFHPNTIFISKRHAQNHGSEHFVYNGIDLDEYPCDLKREDRLVFLAKASWKVKNLAGAIEVARSAGFPLEVLGSRELPLGIQRLLPRWRGVKYHGMVDDIAKRAVLRNARALLFPVRWHEPFGIAITEALASGCAVFGTPYGSLPEIIDASCGIVSDQSADFSRAIRERKFSPETCRARVSQGFTHLQMAEKYLRYYQSVLETGELSPGSSAKIPRAIFKESPEALLPWN